MGMAYTVFTIDLMNVYINTNCNENKINNASEIFERKMIPISNLPMVAQCVLV